MVDTDSQYTKPTGKNIKAALKKFVTSAGEDDILYFHYSGHGTQVADKTGEEEDRQDECLVPTDMNLLTDDDLRAIIKKLTPGAKFTMISDCCHSGGMLDHKEVVIEGDKKLDDDAYDEAEAEPADAGNRALDPADLMSTVGGMTGMDVTDSTSLQAGLMKAFGKAASAKVKSRLQGKKNTGMLDQISDVAVQGFLSGDYKGAAVDEVKQAMGGLSLGGLTGGGDEDEAVKDYDPQDEEDDDGSPVPDDVGVLITGCQNTETSADVRPGNNPAKACGALTNAIITVLKAHKKRFGDDPLSAMQLVLEARELLGKKGFAQNPCLECSGDNAQRAFLTQA